MVLDHDFDIDFNSDLPNIIKVIGVGGGGGNAILNMYSKGLHAVDFVACNTDAQALKQFPSDVLKIQLGAELTKGLGAGTDWKVGEQAALESEKSIRDMLGAPTEMVFVTAGMGGGTGTGAAPVIARIAKELNRLTVGVVTDPFSHEGEDKFDQAQKGIEEMKKYCDTVLVIKNDRLVDMFGDLVLDEALERADDVLANAVKSIAELITRPGKVNLDFADVKTVLGNAGHAVLGSAEANGPDRASIAIEHALSSPLLENNDIQGAKRILVSIAYSDELPEYKIKMSDQSKVTKFVESQIRFKAKIFKHGFAIDRTLKDKVRVTIVAAGFDSIGYKEEEKILQEIELQKKPEVGNGIEALISPNTKPKTVRTTETPQIGLFQEEDKFKNWQSKILKEGINFEDCKTPSYKRFGVELVDIEDIPEENISTYDINEFYEGLKKLNIWN